MWSDDSRPIPEWIERSYEILASHTAEFDDGFLQEQAGELLVAHDGFSAGAADAEYAIERLLSRGWLYEVNGEIRITEQDR